MASTSSLQRRDAVANGVLEVDAGAAVATHDDGVAVKPSVRAGTVEQEAGELVVVLCLDAVQGKDYDGGLHDQEVWFVAEVDEMAPHGRPVVAVHRREHADRRASLCPGLRDRLHDDGELTNKVLQRQHFFAVGG